MKVSTETIQIKFSSKMNRCVRILTQIKHCLCSSMHRMLCTVHEHDDTCHPIHIWLEHKMISIYCVFSFSFGSFCTKLMIPMSISFEVVCFTQFVFQNENMNLFQRINVSTWLHRIRYDSVGIFNLSNRSTWWWAKFM